MISALLWSAYRSNQNQPFAINHADSSQVAHAAPTGYACRNLHHWNIHRKVFMKWKHRDVHGEGGGHRGEWRDNSTQGSCRTFTPLFIHLWGIGKEATGSKHKALDREMRCLHTHRGAHTQTPVEISTILFVLGLSWCSHICPWLWRPS